MKKVILYVVEKNPIYIGELEVRANSKEEAISLYESERGKTRCGKIKDTYLKGEK